MAVFLVVGRQQARIQASRSGHQFGWGQAVRQQHEPPGPGIQGGRPAIAAEDRQLTLPSGLGPNQERQAVPGAFLAPTLAPGVGFIAEQVAGVLEIIGQPAQGGRVGLHQRRRHLVGPGDIE